MKTCGKVKREHWLIGIIIEILLVVLMVVFTRDSEDSQDGQSK